MNGHFETGGIYPLSTVPAEGYGSDPIARSGDVIVAHTNGKFVKIDDDNDKGFNLVADRKEATKFADHSIASITASKLLANARSATAAA